MPKVIQVAKMGLGNHMFAFLLARCIQMNVPNAYIEGYHLSDWGHYSPERGTLPKSTYRVTSHVVPMAALISDLRSGALDAVYIGWPAARVSYYEELQEQASKWLTPQKLTPDGYGAEHLLINIRLGDIVGNLHPDYRPLPISFYEQVVEKTGLAPVFVGQLGKDVYSTELRRRFPKGLFIESRGPFADFETIRRSKNIVVSVSTFSWMAAWLSAKDTQIHMLCAGMYNQRQRPDNDFMPMHDPRYSFYEFPIMRWTGTKSEMDETLTTLQRFPEVPRSQLSFIPDSIVTALNRPSVLS